MRLTSQVIVTTQIENAILELEGLRSSEYIVEIISPSISLNFETDKENNVREYMVQRITTEKETFSVADAKLAIEKAYIASDETTIIVLAAKSFSTTVQNKLLKVIEEPPENKEFILIVESKSTILPTIKSRLPIIVLNEVKEEKSLGLNMMQLSLSTVYEFIQEHKRTDAKNMKYLVERISKEAISSKNYDLDEKTLTLFSNAVVALDVGSPPQFVLNTLLLKLLARKNR